MNLLTVSRLTVILAALSPFVCVAQTSSRAEVERVYNECQIATNKHDIAAFETLLTDDFVFISRYGNVTDRKAFLARQKAGKMLTGVKEDIQSIRLLGETAIVAASFALAGKDKPTNVITTHLYVKQNGAWKWAFFQATIVADPTPTK